MYRPYRDADDSDSGTETSSDIDVSSSEEGSGSNDGVIRHVLPVHRNVTAADQLRYDARLQSMDRWRVAAQSWVPGPGRDVMMGATAPAGAGAEDTGLGMHNTRTTFAERRDVSVLMVDSLDRDQRVYPLPTQMRLALPRVYKNVERIDIVQVKMLSGFYALSAARGNSTLSLIVADVSYSVTIPDGTYSMQQLVDVMNGLFAATAGLTDVTMSFDCVAGRVVLEYAGAGTFSLPFFSTSPTTRQGLYSGWGLGWNLGFGGLPADYEGATRYVAVAFPRLYDDYVFLRLNDTEHMNTVDHTGLENVAISQDSTGQVGHYFGKLLLNTFGCYAQTFVEAPKRFNPVLGRLDRIQFEWVDRWGNVLTGPDAASCDWHMTLRIVEVVEGPRSSASLMLPNMSGAT